MFKEPEKAPVDPDVSPALLKSSRITPSVSIPETSEEVLKELTSIEPIVSPSPIDFPTTNLDVTSETGESF